jgi:hypothetical protein
MDVLGIDGGAPAALVVQLLIGGCLIAKLMGEYLVMRRVNAVARQFKRAEYNIFTYWRDFFRGVWDMRAMLAERYQAVCPARLKIHLLSQPVVNKQVGYFD